MLAFISEAMECVDERVEDPRGSHGLITIEDLRVEMEAHRIEVQPSVIALRRLLQSGEAT